MPIRILLADDHQLLREGVAELLSQAGGEGAAEFDIVAQVSDGRTALRLACELQPDIVLTDITMPELNGIALAEQLHAVAPGIKVVLVSMHADAARYAEALAARVCGYLLKSDSGEHLVKALRQVQAGGTFFSPSLPKPSGDGLAILSPRERETLQLLAEGRTIKDIAGSLKISHKTAETHRAHIMAKLKLYSIADLTRYAVAHGLTNL